MSIMVVPSKTDLYPVAVPVPVAVATGVLGPDLGFGEGFEGDGEEFPLCGKASISALAITQLMP